MIAIGIAIALPGVGAGVPPPPPNPSDADLARAGAVVDGGIARVGDLINQVASVNQQLSQLDDEVAAKREQVNKSLVDLQNARDAADTAAAAVTASRQALDVAGARIKEAQQRFDTVAARTYTDGSGAATLASFVGSATPDAALDRAQLLDQLGRKQRTVLDGLQRARTEAANQDSSARTAKADADTAAQLAQSRKSDAEQAIAAARADVDRQAQRKADLERQRTMAQGQLDAAKANVAGLQGQRVAYQDWDSQRQAEAGAVAAAAQAAQQAALEASARAAANQAARELAADLAAGRRPHTAVEDDQGETDSGQYRRRKPRSSTPAVTGDAAIETVIDRAMSQLGVDYSWGGGDEDGPTLGIRDGGVADSYGDYEKEGFDCSGLMVYAFAGIGISLPHYSGYQYTAGTQYSQDEMQRGDMLFWGPGGSEHVALYLGDDQMIEAPQSGDVVKISPVRYDGMMPNVVRMVDD